MTSTELSVAEWMALVNAPRTIGEAEAIPECDSPQVVYEELMEELRHYITNRPRDLQTRIGPSEIGEECDRALIAKLMEMPEPDEGVNWRAFVGTCIHEKLERIFKRSLINTMGADGPRFLLEQRVTVGTIGGVEITGSIDLLDMATVLVNDWKTKSMTQLKNHRRNGPGQKYRVQAQLYGRGAAALGYPVRNIMFVFVPRDGEWSDIFHYSEPYDPAVAEAALERANRLHALASMLGAETAMAQFGPCTSEWCRTCRDPATLRARPGHGTPPTPDNPFGLTF